MLESLFDGKVPGAMTRDELVATLMWNQGGTGFGLCEVAGAMFWATTPEPASREQDLKSIVAISGPPEKYTDEELRLLVAFARRRTAEYDEMFRYRVGANLICIGKEVRWDDKQGALIETWNRKRLSWNQGLMWSATLEHALALFETGPETGYKVPVGIQAAEEAELRRREERRGAAT